MCVRLLIVLSFQPPLGRDTSCDDHDDSRKIVPKYQSTKVQHIDTSGLKSHSPLDCSGESTDVDAVRSSERRAVVK